ncbi:bacteriohemerythrin [Desulfobacter curvatus]|uniref:bacteriohemerythrin n=1 Tax=Desulfobacter curvatus TaxID=2290 RepID=UPI00036E3983|nr:bacteriohemerythrin [Desulfobacter curvatus]
MKLNFKYKIILPVFFLLIVGLGGLAYIAGSKAKSALRNNIISQLVKTSQSTVVTMDTWVEDRTKDIAAWRTLQICRDALEKGTQGEIARENMSRMFTEWRRQYGFYEGISLADPAGEVISGSPRSIIGKINIGERDYFKASMAGKIKVSDILQSKISGNSAFVISSPIKKGGVVYGVLFAVVDLQAFSAKFTDPVKIGEKGYAYLIDSNGMVVAHPDKSNINRLNLADTEHGQQIINLNNGCLAATVDERAIHNAFARSSKINIIAVVQSDDQEMFTPISALTRFNIIISVMIILCAIVIVWIMASRIVRPINATAAALKDISEGDGDLTQRVAVQSQDEIGELARWVNRFITRLNKIIVHIGMDSETVFASSEELLSVAEFMLEDSESLTGKSETVAAAAGEMSQNMSSVAAATEQAAGNLASVTDAAGQMKQGLDHVAENCDKARQITKTAAETVNAATNKVARLGSSAEDITRVTEVITDIAEQTNLLALNATIEAARAGEAGKGFAVVAGEIKNLAAQTAGATMDIKQRIEEIQHSSNATVQEVEQITQVISEVTRIVSQIAEAIEEQSGYASQVAENIEQASLGIREINENVVNSSMASTQISDDIAEVNEVSGEMTQRSVRLKQSAQDLSSLSGKLRNMIGVFKVSVEEAGVDEEPDIKPEAINDLMPWGRRLALGIPEVDKQHKELVSMVNELHRAMRMKMGNQEAGSILTRLANYTVYHFEYEEKLFDTHGYPDTPNHKKIHKDLVAKVLAFTKEFEEGRAALSMDLMKFLTDWLKNHIMKTDKAYAPFLKEKLGL